MLETVNRLPRIGVDVRELVRCQPQDVAILEVGFVGGKGQIARN